MVVKQILSLFIKAPKVLRIGHPILSKRADAIPAQDLASLDQCIKDMKHCFSSPLTPVIGLAAPQVGHSLRIIAYQITDKQVLFKHQMKPVPLTFLINPVLSSFSLKKIVAYESCESVPHYSAVVPRSESIHVDAWDLDGLQVKKTYTGLLARVIQHEVDHLDGICFVDRMQLNTFRHDKYIGQFETLVNK